ncbi:hypothetical protein QBC41DRAFT_318636 [Cercophora samala]|uniref:Uncharacterized protein n=1 Tax=Cercophora samala TaxID=330535 RepID=A0AA39ZFF1_9PEZI|nr:hypothetical protein QBC41DRAFT_318636 [Cercophora samala]
MPSSFFTLTTSEWPQRIVLLGVILAPLFDVTAAVKFLTAQTAPVGISSECLDALTVDVPCSLYVSRFRPGYYYTETVLDEACTAGCEAGLLSYETSVVSACSSDTWEGYDDDDDGGEQLGTIPSLLRYLYSVICLRDSGRWCNVLGGVAAQTSDPGSKCPSNREIVVVQGLHFRKTAQVYTRARLPQTQQHPLHAICASSKA